jgi:hypothetical protein
MADATEKITGYEIWITEYWEKRIIPFHKDHKHP